MRTIIYLLQVSACTGIFYLFYHVVLSRLTFFTINRWYLLATLIISFVIPAITISEDTIPQDYRVNPVSFSNITEVSISNASPVKTNAVSMAEPFSWISLLPGLYFLITGILTVYLLITLLVLLKQISSDQSVTAGNIKLVKGNKQYKNCSFFNYIFINDELLSPSELEQVIAHELIHIEQKHSIDKVISRITQIVLWFNPFAYAYSNAIEANHEYEVDKRIAEGSDREAYANLILRLAVPGSPFYNHFSKFPLSRRIALLFHKPSRNMKKLIYLLVLPLVVLGCLFFANRELKRTSAIKPAKITARNSSYGSDTVTVGNQRYRPKGTKGRMKSYSASERQEQSERIEKNKKEYAEWEKSPEGKKIHDSMEKATLLSSVGAVVKGIYIPDPQDFWATKGYIINANNYNYILHNFPVDNQMPAGLLNIGDKIYIELAGISYTRKKGMYVDIVPASIKRSNKIIYKQKRVAQPFMRGGDKVNHIEGEIVEISLKKDKNIQITVSSNEYNFLVKFNPSQAPGTDVEKFKKGDYIVLKFINEQKTGTKSYEINDWVSLSKPENYGMINKKLFYQFYERS